MFTLYNGNVSNIDVFVGGLAEDPIPDTNLGILFSRSVEKQFLNVRDGDRFWYENSQFTQEELETIYGTTLSAIVERNFGISGLPPNVFFIQERQLNASSTLE